MRFVVGWAERLKAARPTIHVAWWTSRAKLAPPTLRIRTLRQFLQPAIVPERREGIFLVQMSRARGLVELDAEAWRVGQRELAVLANCPTADEFGSPRHVVIREILLHDDLRRRPPEVHRGRERHRPDGAMRRDR